MLRCQTALSHGVTREEEKGLYAISFWQKGKFSFSFAAILFATRDRGWHVKGVQVDVDVDTIENYWILFYSRYSQRFPVTKFARFPKELKGNSAKLSWFAILQWLTAFLKRALLSDIVCWWLLINPDIVHARFLSLYPSVWWRYTDSFESFLMHIYSDYQLLILMQTIAFFIEEICHLE